jgi:hypothetical protein
VQAADLAIMLRLNELSARYRKQFLNPYIPQPTDSSDVGKEVW